MKAHIRDLAVFHNQDLVGNLSLSNRGKIVFSYDNLWLKNGFNISPIDLEFSTKIQEPADVMFGGLHGVFADSISDGWGLMLTDRALKMKFNWKHEEINQLDRLFFMGSRSMGGLEYMPNDKEKDKNTIFNMEQLFSETQKLIEGEKVDVIKDLYLSGGSPGGARPKAVFAKNGTIFRSGYNNIPDGFDGWIVKFFGKKDSENMGKIEMAYSDMARDAGIKMSETELIELKIKNKKYFFFSTKRFDRNKNKKIHVASLSGLLYASHRVPSLGYQDIFNLTKTICVKSENIEQLSNQMIFNVICHNKDDHTKNFAYLYSDNQWEISPAYDLVFSNSFSNQHVTDINGNGNPNINDIRNILNEFEVKNIDEKIEKVYSVSENWKEYAKTYEIPKEEITKIEKSLSDIRKKFFSKDNKKLKNKP